MSIIAFLLILVIIGAMIYAGQRDGAFFSSYALMRNFIAFLCAMTFAQPVANVMQRFMGGGYPAPDYYVPIGFVLVFAIVFMLGRWLKVQYTQPNVECIALVDRIAGAAVGLMNGFVITGALLILWSLFPFLNYMPADYGYVRPRLDTGAAMLRVYGYVEGRMGGGRVFLLEDEPVDPDLDQNNNGRPDMAGEAYQDLNENGEWDRGWLWRYRNAADLLPRDLEPLNVSVSEEGQ